MAVRRVRSVGPAGFTHRSVGRGSITVGGQARIVGNVAAVRPVNIGGDDRVQRVERGSVGTSGGGSRPSGKTRGR